MLVVMAISFFTVRVVLEKLGISDYGIYNIVGSIVVVFSFLKTTLTSASQRFFSYTIGKGNVVDLIEMFKTNLLFYLIICILIIFFAETVGLWFLNNKLNIPSDRLYAANWVFQMSILGFVFTTLTVPYESVITSHENMGIYAYISILEALLKLMIAYGVIWFSFDKLIVYSILVAISSFIVFLSYLLYCRRKYEECRFGFLWNKDMFKEVVQYSMWNIVGTTASVINGEGSNIVLNVFFGPVVNGARAIAYQIIGIATRFSSNFFTAVRPRLIILYAKGDLAEMYKLINQSAKLSFFLIFMISMPILFQINYVLSLWLGSIPPYVKEFAMLSIITILIDVLSNPLITAAQATGNIKVYQITMSVILVLGIPISYCILLFYKEPEIVFYVSILISIILLTARLIILKSLVKLSIMKFFKDVIFRVLSSSLVSLILILLTFQYVKFDDSTFAFFMIKSVLIFLIVLIVIISLGLNKLERVSFMQYINKIFRRLC